MVSNISSTFSQKKRISLRLWVFKFIDVEDIDSFGVCVEGYRPNDDTATVLRNWHSTAIEKRLSSSLLASHSGTIYELRGSIDRELAHQYGYPIELVTIFSNGFPENWKNVLKEYFHVVRTANPLNASHYFSMLARRRSLNTVRGQNQSCYRGERLFSIASSATLPSAILEESEHEKTENNITDSTDDTKIGSQKEHLCKDSSNAASVASFKEHEDKERTSAENSNSVMTPTCQEELPSMSSSSPSFLASSTKEEKIKISSSDKAETVKTCGEDAIHGDISRRDMKAPTLNSGRSSRFLFEEKPLDSSDSSITFLASRRDELSKIAAPSPASSSSQPQQRDLSPGPIFEDPSSPEEPTVARLAKRKPDTEEDHTRLALVPVPSSVGGPLPLTGRSDGAVELREWSIRFAPLCRNGPALSFPNFVLLGTREDHPSQWQSSIVVRVESARILYTSSTKYLLVGEIDVVDCASAGFPKDFVAQFLTGFPPDWRTQITRLYNSVFGHLGNNKNITEYRSDYRDEIPRQHLFDNDEEIENFQESHCMNSKNIPRAKAHTQNTSVDNSIRYSNSRSSDKSLVSSCKQSAIRRSRSGRCIRSPLAEWAGQRVRYDGAGNVIGVEDMKTSTVHSKGVNNASTVSIHYGLQPPLEPTRIEKCSRMSKIAAAGGPKQVSRRKAVVTHSDSSDNENSNRLRKYVPLQSSDDEVPVRRHIKSKEVLWDEDEYERQLREERLLFLEGARDLRKMQKKLLVLERRITEKEALWLKHREKERRMQRERECYDVVTKRREGNLRETYNAKKGQQKHHKLSSRRYGDEERRHSVEEELERRRLEEEWARQNEQSSQSSDEIDDDSWCEPVRKRKKRPVRKIVVESSSSELSSLDDEQSDEEGNLRSKRNDRERYEPVVKKEKGWSKAELHRLKLAMAAIRVVNDDDWEKVARSLGNTRSPESCKQAAIKRLKWEPPVENEEPAPVTSEVVTARAGTIAYRHQTNEYTRKFMMGAGEQNDDFFVRNGVTLNESIPDVTEFGADDSLLEVLRTPVDVVAQRKGPNRRQFFVEPIDDDTPIRRRSSAALMATPTNSAQRERHDRYLHHIMNKGGNRNDVSRLNHTRNTTRLDTFRDDLGRTNMNTFAELHEDLEDVAKMTKKASRKRNEELDSSDNELELDENHFDDSMDYSGFQSD